MTDNDLLARADREVAVGRGYPVTVAELAAALRARDTELAAARTVTQAAVMELDGLADWLRRNGARGLAEVAGRHAEDLRAWLASVSPPASGEEQ